jgi:hypothetical protein
MAELLNEISLTTKIQTLPYHLRYHIIPASDDAKKTFRGKFLQHLNYSHHFFPTNPTVYPSFMMNLRELEKIISILNDCIAGFDIPS